MIIAKASTVMVSSPTTSCLRLSGVVLDFTSRRPLRADFYIQTPDGRRHIGRSLDETGAFTLSLDCRVRTLIIERTGYRTQTLGLNATLKTNRPDAVPIIIPLLAVDRQGNDQPYLQTEQTHFVQPTVKEVIKGQQPNTFAVADALTGRAVAAQICFVSTESGKKQCLISDNNGVVTNSFTKRDIVALEVTSSGYQSYQGNFIVDVLDGHLRKHHILLVRALTILSVQATNTAYQYVLRSEFGGKDIKLIGVPGYPAAFVSYELLPQRYQLLVIDEHGTVQERRLITVVSGLNSVSVSELEKITGPTVASPAPLTWAGEPPMWNPNDSLPALYFQQSSYVLLPQSETVLKQVAAFLRSYQNYTLHLTGHTDNEGDERLNLVLSEFRANVVATYLRRQGVADKQMIRSWRGSQSPAAPNDREESRAKNRRVSLMLIRNTP